MRAAAVAAGRCGRAAPGQGGCKCHCPVGSPTVLRNQSRQLNLAHATLLQANISTIWSADGEDYTGCAPCQMMAEWLARCSPGVSQGLAWRLPAHQLLGLQTRPCRLIYYYENGTAAFDITNGTTGELIGAIPLIAPPVTQPAPSPGVPAVHKPSVGAASMPAHLSETGAPSAVHFCLHPLALASSGCR